jgi:hypothetical protein
MGNLLTQSLNEYGPSKMEGNMEKTKHRAVGCEAVKK